MSDENPVNPRLAAALAGTARALAAGAAAEAKNVIAARWEKSLTPALGAILNPIAARDDAGELIALRLLALFSLRPAPEQEPTDKPVPAPEKLPPLSPNLGAILGGFFDQETDAGKESAGALAGLLKELSQELARLFTFTAANFPSGPGGPFQKIPPALLRKLEQEFFRRLGKLADLIKKIMVLIGPLPAPRLKLALVLLDVEIRSGELWKRVFIGAGLSLGGMVNDTVQTVFGKSAEAEETPSSRETGNDVHDRLQAAYRAGENKLPALPGASAYLIQDNMVYWPPAGSGELSMVAGSHGDGSLLALVFARYDQQIFLKFIGQGFVSRWLWSQYREDTLDLRRSSLYEIKPVRSAGFGVLQEFQYRHSYNIANGALQDLKDLSAAASGIAGVTLSFLMSIKLFSASLFVFSGPGVTWVPYQNPFQARDRVIFPFTVTKLPGQVLYLTLQSPDLKRLLALSPLVAKILRDELEKLARRAAEALELAFFAIVAVMAAILFGFLLAALAEVLLAIAGTEALLIGGMEALRRLIALVPAPALLSLGLMPSSTRMSAGSDQAAADAVIKGLQEVATKLELTPAFPPQVVADRLLVGFTARPQPQAPVESTLLDLDFSSTSITGLPIAAFPLLKYLHELSVVIAAHAILRHTDLPEPEATPTV